jgi:peptide/nickel transport system substrate-binding protein
MDKLDVVAVSNFAYPWSAIVETGSADTLKTQPVGTGPFKLKSWVPQQSLTLEKNPDYYEPAKLTTVNFKMMPDATAQISSLRNGELDIIGVSGEQVSAFAGDPAFTVVSNPSNALQIMAMNLDNEALSDLRVRQAINHAIEKNLIETVWHGYGEMIGSHFPPVLKEYVDHNGVYPYDVEKAKQLLVTRGTKTALRSRCTFRRNSA